MIIMANGDQLSVVICRRACAGSHLGSCVVLHKKCSYHSSDCLMLRNLLASNLRHGGSQYAMRLGRCVVGGAAGAARLKLDTPPDCDSSSF